MLCPDCGHTLIDVATVCRCGWRKPEQPKPGREEQLARFEAEMIGDVHQKAVEGLKAKGLERKPGEPLEMWTARLRAWCKGKAVKRFNDKGISA